MSWSPHHQIVTPARAAPRGCLLLLHGLLGSGGNWRTIARRLVATRPDWGAVLVDLRMHGRSQDAPPPHTIAAAAGDLAQLGRDLAGRDMPVRAVCGHSLGGKVALAYRAARPGGLLDTWVLDASPSARAEPRDRSDPDGVGGVMAALAELPALHPDRAGFVAALGERGVSRPVAEWLAMNLEPAPGGELRLRLDLAALGELLADHDRAELWSALEPADLPGAAHVVVAGRSSAVAPPDRARLAELAAAGRIALHLVPDAGHWLHIEAPDQLLALLAAQLPALP